MSNHPGNGNRQNNNGSRGKGMTSKISDADLDFVNSWREKNAAKEEQKAARQQRQAAVEMRRARDEAIRDLAMKLLMQEQRKRANGKELAFVYVVSGSMISNWPAAYPKGEEGSWFDRKVEHARVLTCEQIMAKKPRLYARRFDNQEIPQIKPGNDIDRGLSKAAHFLRQADKQLRTRKPEEQPTSTPKKELATV